MEVRSSRFDLHRVVAAAVAVAVDGDDVGVVIDGVAAVVVDGGVSVVAVDVVVVVIVVIVIVAVVVVGVSARGSRLEDFLSAALSSPVMLFGF